ncbi:MAG: hypothetical protein JNL21_29275 [Myxococcales bacterium]|nr:hypothetical protein [Myxococcales bacterium]
MKEPEALSGELSELVEAEREIDSLLPDARARMLSRLADALPGLAPPSVAPPGSAPALPSAGASTVPGPVSVVSWMGSKGVAIACLALGLAGGALAHKEIAGSSRVNERLASLPRTVTLVVTREVDRERPPIDLADVPSSASSEARSGGRPNIVPHPIAPPKETSLKRERLLLESARTALHRGDRESAAAALARHAAEFPTGQLAAERAVLQAQLEAAR